MSGIVIIDYGMGNLKSVGNAFAHEGFKVRISGLPGDVAGARGLVLPGVGAFGRAMANLEERGLISPLRERVLTGTPFLGICLGLQLLFEASEEAPGVTGLSLLPGKVARFRGNFKIPLIGWNGLQVCRQSPLFQGVTARAYFYFVHSYYAQPREREDILALSSCGGDFPAVVGRQNLFGLQFHPEKSGREGLKIIRNFGRMVTGREHHSRH